VQRYLVEKVKRQTFGWRFNNKPRAIPQHKSLRLMLPKPATVRWSLDGWVTSQETKTRDTSLGVHRLDLPTASLPIGGEVAFTFYWPEEDRWEGTDYSVQIK
jgi:glucoamylase